MVSHAGPQCEGRALRVKEMPLLPSRGTRII